MNCFGIIDGINQLKDQDVDVLFSKTSKKDRMCVEMTGRVGLASSSESSQAGYSKYASLIKQKSGRRIVVSDKDPAGVKNAIKISKIIDGEVRWINYPRLPREAQRSLHRTHCKDDGEVAYYYDIDKLDKLYKQIGL